MGLDNPFQEDVSKVEKEQQKTTKMVRAQSTELMRNG